MTDASNVFTTKLSDLDRDEWFAAMGKLGRKYGMYEKLGDKHAALLVDEGETLVVTFETVEDIRDENPGSEPLGFDLIRATGWSLLSVMSDGDTWSRDPKVYEFFDALTDDGFFDGFDRSVF